MFEKIRRLGTDTAIYGISTILGRFLNFLLVPFYTNVLLPDEYGVVTYVYSIIAFVNVVYSYGMESSYFKYASTLEIGSAKQNFSTPFISLVVSSAAFSALMLASSTPVCNLLSLPPDTSGIIMCAAGILALDAVAIIPFAALRLERRARLFAMIKFLNILINVILNIVLLVVLRFGGVGIFLSGLGASAVTLVLLLPVIRRNFTIDARGDLWKRLMRFGLPFIPAGLASMVVQVIDRPILRALTDDATVGIYQANYRLGILMMLVVSMYDYAWRPFYFSTANDPDAKQVFARVLTYVVLFMTGIFLLVSFFVRDVVALSVFGRHIIHPSYWSGLSIVPIVLLGYLFLGVSTSISAGLYIMKKTEQLPIIAFSGAIINIGVNYLLIPIIGITGAAWATFLAYFVMALLTYILVQRAFPITYEYLRLLKVAGAGSIVFAIGMTVPEGSFEWLYKLGLLLLFPLLLLTFRFAEAHELSRMRHLLSRLTQRNDKTQKRSDSNGPGRVV